MEERVKKIIEACLKQTSTNPIAIFNHIANSDFIRIHGPEHHILDGAALLTAFYNAKGSGDLLSSLQALANRGLNMPGAMCGHWGVCGAVTSMGATLSIIDQTGPLSNDGTWEKHMEFTSKALQSLANVGGPRCCKRDAFLAFQEAIAYINNNYDVKLDTEDIHCTYSSKNSQCLHHNCPFYPKKKIAFICVHNSCRSQIAEALGKHLASDAFDFFSAGTETKPQINQDAVRLMKELYGIDMEQTQYSKTLDTLPTIDSYISMGCNVECPAVHFSDNWQLEDPTGKSDKEFKNIIHQIETRIIELKNSKV